MYLEVSNKKRKCLIKCNINYIWEIGQRNVLSSTTSGTGSGVDVCDVGDEELDNSKLLRKVIQSFAGINDSGLSNSTVLISVVKDILGDFLTKRL